MLDAYIYDGLRSPIGRHAGALAPVRPDDLLAGVMKELMARSAFKPEQLEDIVIGCANQGGEDSRCISRHAGLLAGLPIEVGGTVLQRNCASGLNAVAYAAQVVTAGEGDLFIAGGVESMSRAPFVMAKSESAYSRDFRVFDSTIGPRFPNPKVEKQFGDDSMPQTADNLAQDIGVPREAADVFALASQRKYAAAKADGFFDGEIAPVSIAQRKGDPKVVAADEHPRPDTTMEALQKLKPLYEGGVTTAGNASGVNDGAAALLVGSRAIGEKAGVKPLARILATAAAGVPPRIMGYGPVPSSQKALARAGLTLKDMDVIEINEAFAAQVLADIKPLGIGEDRLNVGGGGIALGHPIGASGARVLVTLIHHLHRTGGKRGVCSLCLGGGNAVSMLIETC
jgi:acetyl-CoA C-acetyltransferase